MSLDVPDTEWPHQRPCQENILLDLVELQVANGVLGALFTQIQLYFQLFVLPFEVQVDKF